MDPYHSFPCSYFFQGTETFYNCFHCTLYWFKQKLCFMMKNPFLLIYQQKKNYFPHSRQSEFFLGKSNLLQCWVGGRTPPPPYSEYINIWRRAGKVNVAPVITILDFSFLLSYCLKHNSLGTENSFAKFSIKNKRESLYNLYPLFQNDLFCSFSKFLFISHLITERLFSKIIHSVQNSIVFSKFCFTKSVCSVFS